MAKKGPSLATSHQAEPAPVVLAKPHKAFTMERVPGGWVAVTLTFVPTADGATVLSIERTQPDLKSITIEKFKIAAFNYWGQG